ncbi:putative lipid II flippase FtsW [Nitrospina sp. 32_T5]|uniref:putative lipid II flippase FtsW n=1 Tax=unclassified Nitrospina TaxID=2638683 RepID=UPI003F97DDA8
MAQKNAQPGCDRILAFAVALLVLIGIVMVFSSSAVYAMEEYQDSWFFLKRHLLWVLIGTAMLFAAKSVDYHKLDGATYPVMAATVFLLIAVMMPEMSKEVGGARRWLVLGGFSFQPSELAKFAVILFMAKSLVKRADKLGNFAYGFLPNLIVLGIFFMLILLQPDFGTALIISIVCFTMLYIAGVKKNYLVYSVIAAAPFLISAVLSAEYRKRRLLSFLDPWADPSDTGFQAVQSFLAFGRGGIWGLGLGDSRQKLFYLPEAHTDFIFSVVGEELGFIGTMGILALFMLVLWRGFKIAYHAKDIYGTHLATGLTLLVAIQAFTNMGVAVGLLPTKGLTLPFISLGGSSLLITMLGMGVLLNISEQTVRR